MDPTILWIKVQIVSWLFAPLCVLAVAALLDHLLTMLAGNPRQLQKARESTVNCRARPGERQRQLFCSGAFFPDSEPKGWLSLATSRAFTLMCCHLYFHTTREHISSSPRW